MRPEERRLLLELSRQAASNEKAEADGSEAAVRARTIRALADGQIGRNDEGTIAGRQRDRIDAPP